MVILGIDPGLGATGYGVIEKNKNELLVKKYGVIQTDRLSSFPQRLKKIYNQLIKIIKKYRPNIIVIESLFFYKNLKTAILVGEAKGVAILACANTNIKVVEYTPLQVKEALVGYGRASKQQVKYMVKRILNLDKVPDTDDAADALAVAICHANTIDYSNI
jgi:crossover junction endodeoxyribonuclease RuvC